MKKLWSEIELKYLIENYPNNQTVSIADKLHCSVSRVYNKAFSLGLKKSIEYLESDSSGRLSKRDTRGLPFRFPKGHAPFNKGKTWDDYLSEEGRTGALKTTFKNGHLPHNTKSDGEISIRTDEGRQYKYIRIKKAKWLPLHVYLWQKEHGDIPDGMIVVFKNKNTMDCDILNLELITREENMRRNSVHRYPPELKFAIRKLKQLKRTINGKEQNSRSERSFV